MEACLQVARCEQVLHALKYATSVCEQVLHALKSVARANNCTGEARLWALSALQVLSRCSRHFFF